MSVDVDADAKTRNKGLIVLGKELLESEAILPSTEDINNICRLCANSNDKVVGIYSEQGVFNELSIKMNRYLPIKVTEDDTLPLHCCWNCVSTVLAWHELVVISVETDRRLRSLIDVDDNKTGNVPNCESIEETNVPVQDDRSRESTVSVFEKTIIEPQSISEIKIEQQLELKPQILQQYEGIKKRRQRVDIEYKIFCDICNKGFTRHLDMKRHRFKIHANTPTIQSYSTDRVFSIQEDTSGGKSYTCLLCDEEFSAFKNFNLHLKVHKKEKRVRRTKSEIIAGHFCNNCGKGFTRKFDMQKHVKNKHPNEVPNKLIEPTKSRISEKCKIIEEGEKFYKCESCNKVFHQAYNFLRHQTIHTGVREYFCHICGKDFRVSGGLKRHISEHHYGVKKYECDVCGQHFAAKTARDEHKNIHTNNRPFVCSTCGKAFRQKASLHTHTLFHTNNYRFSCDVCNKKYRRATELKLHSLLHSGDKPHHCNICPSKFRLSQDLKRHLKIHNNSKEFICHECGSKFSQERYLKNHRKLHQKAVNHHLLPF